MRVGGGGLCAPRHPHEDAVALVVSDPGAAVRPGPRVEAALEPELVARSGQPLEVETEVDALVTLIDLEDVECSWAVDRGGRRHPDPEREKNRRTPSDTPAHGRSSCLDAEEPSLRRR